MRVGYWMEMSSRQKNEDSTPYLSNYSPPAQALPGTPTTSHFPNYSPPFQAMPGTPATFHYSPTQAIPGTPTTSRFANFSSPSQPMRATPTTSAPPVPSPGSKRGRLDKFLPLPGAKDFIWEIVRQEDFHNDANK